MSSGQQDVWGSYTIAASQSGFSPWCLAVPPLMPQDQTVPLFTKPLQRLRSLVKSWTYYCELGHNILSLKNNFPEFFNGKACFICPCFVLWVFFIF